MNIKNIRYFVHSLKHLPVIFLLLHITLNLIILKIPKVSLLHLITTGILIMLFQLHWIFLSTSGTAAAETTISITAPENTSPDPLSGTITITNDCGNEQVVSLSQSGICNLSIQQTKLYLTIQEVHRTLHLPPMITGVLNMTFPQC